MVGDDAAASAGEKKGGISKKEQKKMAKKADKEAKNKGSGGATSPGASVISQKSTKAAPPPPLRHYLAHASEGCAATLKASVASAAFGVDLRRAPKKHEVLPFLHGPALVGADGPVVFGGNSIAKALSLLGGGAGMGFQSAEVDDWLEFERKHLRPAVSGGTAAAKKSEAALKELETALSSNGSGSFLVGQTCTVADVSISTTLHLHGSAVDLEKLPAVKKYLETHTSSEAFRQGLDGVSVLLPKVRPVFDYANHPSLVRAVGSIFSDAMAIAFPDADDLGLPPVVAEKCKQMKHGDFQW